MGRAPSSSHIAKRAFLHLASSGRAYLLVAWLLERHDAACEGVI